MDSTQPRVTNATGPYSACDAALFSIYNNGTSNVTLSGASPFVTISGATSSNFTVSTPPTSPINSGAGPIGFAVTATTGPSGPIVTAKIKAVDSATNAPFTFPVLVENAHGC